MQMIILPCSVDNIEHTVLCCYCWATRACHSNDWYFLFMANLCYSYVQYTISLNSIKTMLYSCLVE